MRLHINLWRRKDMFDDVKKDMDQVLKVVQDDLALIRTGRARPDLVENVEIEAYPGSRLALKELASISAPDTHMLVISPWDQSILKAIETGLSKSELQLNPVIDGNIVRIAIPQLTEERRLDLVKLTKQKIESGHQMMRDVRNEAKKSIDAQKGEAGVSEDDIERWLEELQKLHEEYLTRLKEMGEQKEKELMEM
jgi:ribosome recycling factor